jgi:protein-disulfide isomerase
MISVIFSNAFAAKTSPNKKVNKQQVAIQKRVENISSESFSDKQIKEIQNITHDYLLKNPKILMEMSRSLQNVRENEIGKMQSDTKSLIGKYTKELFDTKNHFAIGNPNGDVVIIEFFDYQCGHCKTMGGIVKNLVKSDPKLEVIFLDWPIFGVDSVYAVKAALAARNQNKYMEMHDALLASENPLKNEKVLQIAKSIGLDEKKLKSDIADKNIDNIIKANFKLAQNLKLIAAPAFIFSNRQGSKVDFVLGQTGENDLRRAIETVRK